MCETEEDSQTSWAMRAWKHDEMNVDVHVDSEWARLRDEVVEWRHDDAQQHSGETLVEQSMCALSTAEADHSAVISEAAEAPGMQSRNAVDDDGHGTECAGSRLDDLQRSQGCCIQKVPWEDQTCGIEIVVPAGGDQIGKSENEGVQGKRTI